MNFGVKVIQFTVDPRFKRMPFTPVRFCDIKDKQGEFLLGGHDSMFKRVSQDVWVPLN